MPDWNTNKRTEVANFITTNELYIKNDINTQLAALNQATGKETGNQKTLLDSYYSTMSSSLNAIKAKNKELTAMLDNTESSNYKVKLNQIGQLQQTIKSRKADLKKLTDELEVAEAREDAIKNRNEESSYAQTFGYIFRPFRRLSYAIIVPLIFIMVVASVYLLWTSPTTMKISTTQSLPQASAPPANNFNAQLKKMLK